MEKRLFLVFLSPKLLGLTLLILPTILQAQTEVEAWGNIRGVRVNGQMLRFETSLRTVGSDWSSVQATAMERYWCRYSRQNGAQLVRTRMDSLFWTQRVRDLGSGRVGVELTVEPHTDMEVGRSAFFHVKLPAGDFDDTAIRQIEPGEWTPDSIPARPSHAHEVLRVRAKGLSLRAPRRTVDIFCAETLEILVAKIPTTGDLELYFALHPQTLKSGEKIVRQFELSVTGTASTAPVDLRVFPEYPGNIFTGMGGNFRLQNQRDDPKVIDYCLQNMDVRMGRVELPWRAWHPTDTIDPLAAARQGRLDPHVKASMLMAQRLHNLKMPVLLAAWFPPTWAVEGVVNRDPRNPDGTWGNPLRADRMEQIYASLAAYIQYLQEAYQVEVAMFSFNESDLGINVRQTAKEHAAFIKGFGAYLQSKGLKTKLLLGDTADANGFPFVGAAVDDPETWAYIGAVSFHSWRGWAKETLETWYAIADRLNAPLIVGEGSIDAAAWRYPQIFKESHYALDEIKLYVRLLAICQPQAILQWQLTSDYAPLIGGGLYGNDSLPLQATQRFHNLKQLGMTPPGLRILPITCPSEELFATALGDAKRNTYAVHVVNMGSVQTVSLSGLPPKVKKVRCYVTDAQNAVKMTQELEAQSGRLTLQLPAASFVTLISGY